MPVRIRIVNPDHDRTYTATVNDRNVWTIDPPEFEGDFPPPLREMYEGELANLAEDEINGPHYFPETTQEGRYARALVLALPQSTMLSGMPDPAPNVDADGMQIIY